MRTVDQIVTEIYKYKASHGIYPEVLKLTRKEYNALYKTFSLGTMAEGTDPPKDISGSKFYGIPLEIVK